MRRLIVCADGTWNKPDQKDRGKRKPSNVVKIARAIHPVAKDGVTQVVFYEEGIGTHWGVADKYVGGGTGLGLSKNVLDCYRFLAQNYAEGDEVYLWGFSRGAYTVRSLAAFIDLIGIMPKSNVFYLPEGFKIYKIKDAIARKQEAEKFIEKNNCSPITINFLGVWDTVGALGVPLGFINKLLIKNYQFHNMSLPLCVTNAFHALAIDEHRKAFKPSLWDSTSSDNQIMEQRWFVGAHTNIGGGYDNDGLANIPLHWMKDKAKSIGLEFDEDYLKYFKPWKGDELRDSFSTMYKILQLTKPYNRKIGMTAHGNEQVDESALERLNDTEQDPPYNSKSLKDWVARAD